MNSIPTLPPACQPRKRCPDAKTILVVEDFEPLCDLVARHLSSSGYHVIAAHDAAEACRMVEANEQIDLLLTDLNMPGLRGDELAAWFAIEHPTVPIILMSCQPVPLSAVRDIGFLQKPFALCELGAAVRNALGPQFVNSPQRHERSLAA